MILHYLLAKIRKIKTKNKEKRRKNKHRAVNYAKFDAFLSVIRSNLDIFVYQNNHRKQTTKAYE